MSPRSFLALICIAALWAAFPTIANAMPAAASANDGAARIHYVGRVMQRVAKLLVIDLDDVDEFLHSCYQAASVDAVP